MTVARLRWPDKDPNEFLAYSIDWSDILGGDGVEIAFVSWVVEPGLAHVKESVSGYQTDIELGGGTNGETYEVRCEIEASDGHTYSRTVLLDVVTR